MKHQESEQQNIMFTFEIHIYIYYCITLLQYMRVCKGHVCLIRVQLSGPGEGDRRGESGSRNGDHC